MDFFTQGISTLATIVMAIGAGFAGWGIINLMDGYGNDNPGAKSQGVKQAMAGGGIIFVGLKLIPLLANLFQ
ncbi:Maff2 family mobile element protein [Ethanoligenens sp.]|uniref:Maff2 family mobile element protein n=1 Tax=Ethanoligenens sp. TaxID=2099655 RepID=UPI0039EB5D35